MKKAIATKWIKALRSGKYTQGQHALRYDDEQGVTHHCCLGVLCELYNEEKKRKQEKGLKVQETENPDNIPSSVTVYAFGKESGVLPKKVKEWAGLESPCGEFFHKQTYALTELNDEGKSFKQIANIIERRVDDL